MKLTTLAQRDGNCYRCQQTLSRLDGHGKEEYVVCSSCGEKHESSHVKSGLCFGCREQEFTFTCSCGRNINAVECEHPDCMIETLCKQLVEVEKLKEQSARHEATWHTLEQDYIKLEEKLETDRETYMNIIRLLLKKQ